MTDASSTATAKRGGISLTKQIFIGLALGIALGAVINNIDPSWSA